MAKRETKKVAPPTGEVLDRLQESMAQLQRDADALMQRTQQQAVALISRDQRKAIENLFRQALRLREDLEKRAQRASRDVESRAERFLATLEKETAKRVSPLLKRLDLPSRQDVQALARRVSQIERDLGKRSPAAAPRGKVATKKLGAAKPERELES